MYKNNQFEEKRASSIEQARVEYNDQLKNSVIKYAQKARDLEKQKSDLEQKNIQLTRQIEALQEQAVKEKKSCNEEKINADTDFTFELYSLLSSPETKRKSEQLFDEQKFRQINEKLLTSQQFYLSAKMLKEDVDILYEKAREEMKIIQELYSKKFLNIDNN